MNRWKDRTAERARATDAARYGRASSPWVEAESDATNERTVASSTIPGEVTPRAARNARYRLRSRR